MEPKISVITDEFGTRDLEQVADYLAAEGFRYVELRGVWIKNVITMDDDDIGAVKDVLADRALQVSSISGGVLKTPWWGPADEPELTKDGTPVKEYQLRIAANCIHVAAELGAPFIRVFGFTKMGPALPEAWDDWLAALTTIAADAAAEGKTLILENEAACTVSDRASILKAFDALSARAGNVKLLFDPGNLFHGGEDVTPEVLAEMFPLAAYVHAKDAVVTSDNPRATHWTIIGDGEVGWPGIIQQFQDLGYDSFWSVETHMGKKGAWENTAKNLSALRALLS
jgi:sugar phosphate isomerase/epimerase